DGDHLLTFYRGDQKIVTISHHHGTGLRWYDKQWPGDGALTDASQAALPRWFQENGYAVFQTDRENRIKAAKEQADKEARFINCFPEGVRKYFAGTRESAGALTFDAEDKRVGKALATAAGDATTLAVSLCRAFGTLEGYEASWTSTTGKERKALEAAKTLDG